MASACSAAVRAGGESVEATTTFATAARTDPPAAVAVPSDVLCALECECAAMDESAAAGAADDAAGLEGPEASEVAERYVGGPAAAAAAAAVAVAALVAAVRPCI